ncbi:unnamed protein product, partial [Cyprideis torosa]
MGKLPDRAYPRDQGRVDMTIIIPFDEGEKQLDWIGLTDALEAGHRLGKAEITDVFLHRSADTMLNRSAWIDGLGLAVKVATVFPGNPAQGVPMINGAVSLFDDAHGTLAALVDFHLVTKWKTAGDSLLAARKLARPDSEHILIVGAGTVGGSLYDAYRSIFPQARFTVWNRTADKARAFAEERGIAWSDDLQMAVGQADIVTSATMSTEPLIKGAWLKPGQHIDLIGAYRPDMRETDDAALQRARVFVDSFDTTLGHIGEIKIPLETGALRREDVLADYYDIARFQRRSDDGGLLHHHRSGLGMLIHQRASRLCAGNRTTYLHHPNLGWFSRWCGIRRFVDEHGCANDRLLYPAQGVWSRTLMVPIRAVMTSAIMLALFALVGTGLVASINALTKDQIAANIRESTLRSLGEVLPADRYNNDLLHSTRQISATELNSKSTATVYLARKDGAPVAALFEVSTLRGYSGLISALVGVNYD